MDPDFCPECSEAIDMDNVIDECVSDKYDNARDDRDEDKWARA